MSWKRHCVTHWREQRGRDSYLPRQISQSDCEISSNCGKILCNCSYNRSIMFSSCSKLWCLADFQILPSCLEKSLKTDFNLVSFQNLTYHRHLDVQGALRRQMNVLGHDFSFDFAKNAAKAKTCLKQSSLPLAATQNVKPRCSLTGGGRLQGVVPYRGWSLTGCGHLQGVVAYRGWSLTGGGRLREFRQ